MLKSGRRRVKVRVVGSDLCNIDKEVWRSLVGNAELVRKARKSSLDHVDSGEKRNRGWQA